MTEEQKELLNYYGLDMNGTGKLEKILEGDYSHHAWELRRAFDALCEEYANSLGLTWIEWYYRKAMGYEI